MIRRPAAFLLPLSAILAYTGGIEAQSRPALWGELGPGQHAVGYRVLYALDHSRVWNVVPDTLSPSPQEFARPVRISVWYPAAAAADAGVMTYGEFLFDEAPNQYFAQLNELLARRFIETVRGGMPELSDQALSAVLPKNR